MEPPVTANPYSKLTFVILTLLPFTYNAPPLVAL